MIVVGVLKKYNGWYENIIAIKIQIYLLGAMMVHEVAKRATNKLDSNDVAFRTPNSKGVFMSLFREMATKRHGI